MSLFSIQLTHKKNLILIGLLVVLTFIAFSPVLKAPFFNWEDDLYLTHNFYILKFNFLQSRALFAQPIHDLSVPLTNIVFVLEHRLFGLNPFVYHLNSLLLHIAAVLLVFFLALRLGFGGLQAFLGALIFAILPSKVEAVAWISQRKEILCTVFYLAALINHQKGSFRLGFCYGVLSVLSSPLTALSLPLAIVGVDWLTNRSSFNAKKVLNQWPYFLMVFVLALLINWSKWSIILSELSQIPLILPAMFSSAPFYGGSKSLIALQHAFYLPSVVFSLVIAWGIFKLHQFLKTQEVIILHLFSVAIIVLILGLGLLTFNQALLWQSPVSLWRLQLKAKAHPMAYNQLAGALRHLNEYRQSEMDYRAYNDLIREGADENKITFNKEKFNKAREIIKLYQDAIALDPQYVNSYYNLAQFYQDIDGFDDALIWYNKLLNIDPKNKEALYGLGLMYQKMNQPKQSIDAFNRLLQAHPENEDVYVNVVDAYTRAVINFPDVQEYKEQRENVLSSYEQLSKRKKYSAVDYFNLGFLYEQVGGYEEAIRFYKKALEINPKYEKALYNLANRYQEMGDLKTSLALYQKLVHDHPRYALGYLNMGVIYNAMGDVKRARMYYQKTIEVDPTNVGGYFNLGFLSELKGELKEALNYYEKAVEQDPLLAEGYYNMGNVYAALGQNAEAIASYLKTIGIDKNHQNAFVNLSILSFKSGNFTDALHYLEEAQLLGYTPPAEYLKSLAPYRKKK